MQVTPRAKLMVRLQAWLFLGLFLAVIATLSWLSTRYVQEWDWTAGARNTLSMDSQRLLAEMPGPVSLAAYVREDASLRGGIRDLVRRYQRHKPDIILEFVNPDARPERVREAGITTEGEVVVGYQGRSEKVGFPTEKSLTNALLRVARQGERWVVFLAGHGERDPLGEANHDLGEFGRALQKKGFHVQQVRLGQTPTLPANTHLLVVAGPRVDLLEGEVEMVRRYLRGGGNLLWLGDPGDLHGLRPLAEDLGVEFLPGVVVDATTQLLGIQNPAFALVSEYPLHAVTREINTLTLFPEASALEVGETRDWEAVPLLGTLSRSWTETGELMQEIAWDAGTQERRGPLDIAFAFTRNLAGEDEEQASEQRVVVIGDGDFLSNAYLGNAGNLDLGLNLFHWLGHEEQFLNISPRTAPDRNLELDSTAQMVIAFGFLVALPLTMVVTGLAIWLRRRKR